MHCWQKAWSRRCAVLARNDGTSVEMQVVRWFGATKGRQHEQVVDK